MIYVQKAHLGSRRENIPAKLYNTSWSYGNEFAVAKGTKIETEWPGVMVIPKRILD